MFTSYSYACIRFTYLLFKNIDIDIAIFCKISYWYHTKIEILISNQHYSAVHYLAVMCRCLWLGNGFTPVKQRSASKHQQNGSKPTRRPAGEDGLVYPVDLWYLIGGFIAPEDVRTFACICHDTHSVVHSARFWLCLYRRSACYWFSFYKLSWYVFIDTACIY